MSLNKQSKLVHDGTSTDLIKQVPIKFFFHNFKFELKSYLIKSANLRRKLSASPPIPISSSFLQNALFLAPVIFILFLIQFILIIDKYIISDYAIFIINYQFEITKLTKFTKITMQATAIEKIVKITNLSTLSLSLLSLHKKINSSLTSRATAV